MKKYNYKSTTKIANTFADCPRCKRPYKKTAKYPNEICNVCKVEENL